MRKRKLCAKISGGAHNFGFLFYALLFLFMLVCNRLTPLIADDFQYFFSFRTYDRVTCVADIIPSMLAHMRTMNGRVVAHFLVQLFSLVPTWVFDFFNSGIFVLQVWLISKIARGKEQESNWVPVLILGAVWAFQPGFGQVNLWQDGAVNYLWGNVVCFIFLKLYTDAFLWEKRINFKWWGYPLLAFTSGAFSETASLAMIVMAGLLLLLDKFYAKRKSDTYLWILLIVACLGYLSIYLAPAQWEKAEVGAQISLLEIFGGPLRHYATYVPLLLAFVLLSLANWKLKTQSRRILVALVLLVGSLVSCFVLIVASYLPERCFSASCVFLICADVVLLHPLFQTAAPKKACSVVAALLALACLWTVPTSVKDIYRTYREIGVNEQYLLEQKAAGNLDITLPPVETSSSHNGLYELAYLNKGEPTLWPNKWMAAWYGIGSIRCTEKFK